MNTQEIKQIVNKIDEWANEQGVVMEITQISQYAPSINIKLTGMSTISSDDLKALQKTTECTSYYIYYSNSMKRMIIDIYLENPDKEIPY